MSKAKTLAATVSAGGVLADGTVSAAEVSGLATVATSGAYADLSGRPSLAAVATSGAYADLSGKPTLPSGAIVGTTDTQTLTNKTLTAPTTSNEKLTTVREAITVSATAATGTINYDALTQSILYYTTNASGNFTVNFRGNSSTTLNTMMAVGESLTVAFLVTNGATPYYNSAVQVDGNAITPKWQGGTAPSAGNASSVDAYSYTIIKTGDAAFTVLAAQTQFK